LAPFNKFPPFPLAPAATSQDKMAPLGMTEAELLPAHVELDLMI
jgi:hypothetical protein